MLTTMDNPFDPRTDYNLWHQWDEAQGYNTASYLARILQNFEKIDEEYTIEAIDEAQQSIMDNDMLGIYKKV